MATMTDAQIRLLARVASWTKGYDINQYGTRIATLRVLNRLGMIATRTVFDRRAREDVRREFATDTGIAELRRLAMDVTLDRHTAQRVREALAEVDAPRRK